MTMENISRRYFITIVVLFLVMTWTSTATAGPPTNLNFRCPNMNCTISWSPPLDAVDNGTVIYSVLYQSCNKVMTLGLIAKPGCTNITHAYCNLGADLKDPHKYWCAFVKADRNNNKEDGMLDVPAVMHPANDASVERPELVSVNTTSHSVYVEWIAPKTPYTDHHGNLYRVNHFQRINYNMTYWPKSHPDRKKHLRIPHTRHALLGHEGNHIKPGKTYEIVLQASINSIYGAVTHVTATTEEEVPSTGVIISKVTPTTLDCSKGQELREVTIEWLPLENKYSKLTHHQLEYWIPDQRDETLVLRKLHITTSVVVHVSRWHDYDLVVHTCNAVGCTPHVNHPHHLQRDELHVTHKTDQLNNLEEELRN